MQNRPPTRATGRKHAARHLSATRRAPLDGTQSGREHARPLHARTPDPRANHTCGSPFPRRHAPCYCRGGYPGIQLVSVLVMTGNGGGNGLSGHRAGRSPAAVGRTGLDPARPPPWLFWRASGLRAPTMARLFSGRSCRISRSWRPTQLSALRRRGHSHESWRHSNFTPLPSQDRCFHSRPALRHPHFCLLQVRFGSGPTRRL